MKIHVQSGFVTVQFWLRPRSLLDMMGIRLESCKYKVIYTYVYRCQGIPLCIFVPLYPRGSFENYTMNLHFLETKVQILNPYTFPPFNHQPTKALNQRRPMQEERRFNG